MTDADVVLQGGGSNVIGLVSAAYELRRKVRIARVAGTSAGGLAAVALAFGVDPVVLRSTLERVLQGNQLLDGDLAAFLTRFGWCRGDALRRTVRQLVGEGTRMGDALTPVAVVVGDLYMRAPRVLSSWATPNVLVEDAAVATAAIPGVFAAQEVRGLGVGNRLHVDGGVTMNFALDLFDDEPERMTIGLRPDDADDGQLRPVRDLKAYVWAIAALRQWSANNAYGSKKSRVVVVDVPGGDGLDFSLSVGEIARRWNAGVKAATAASIGG